MQQQQNLQNMMVSEKLPIQNQRYWGRAWSVGGGLDIRPGLQGQCPAFEAPLDPAHHLQIVGNNYVYNQCCGSLSFWCRSDGIRLSIFYADPDQNVKDPHADPTKSFTLHIMKNRNFRHSITSLQYLFFSSVPDLSWFSVIFTAYWKKSEKSMFFQLYHWLGIDTDSDPDAAKWCGSDQNRIHTTAYNAKKSDSAASIDIRFRIDACN